MRELTSEEVSAGGLLAARRRDILRHLESRLRDTGNSLGQDPAVLPECLARADAVLARTESDLIDPAPPERAGLPPGGAGAPRCGGGADAVRTEAHRNGRKCKGDHTMCIPPERCVLPGPHQAR